MKRTLSESERTVNRSAPVFFLRWGRGVAPHVRPMVCHQVTGSSASPVTWFCFCEPSQHWSLFHSVSPTGVPGEWTQKQLIRGGKVCFALLCDAGES